MPDFFKQAFPAGMSYERTFKIWGWRSCSYHLVLEEYGSPLIGSLMEDPLISFDVLSSAFKYGNRCFTEYPADMPDFFKQAFPAGMSYERTFKIWGWRSCSYHLVLEEYGSPLIGSLMEDPLISFDVLSSAFKYGNRCFTEYPADMLDFFEQAFPAGMSYERTYNMKYENFHRFFMRFFRSFLWHWDHENVID